MTTRRRVLLTVTVALAAFAAPVVCAPGASIWQSFEARDLHGNRWTAEELTGRVVLLDFWATWCAPCLAAIPTLREATERYGDEGFLVLGISLDRAERRRLENFLSRRKMEWPQIHDGRGVEGPLARRFRVTAVPRTYLVDRSGRVVGVDLAGDVLLAALPALLAEPVGEPATAGTGR